MKIQDAIPHSQDIGGMLIPRTETHFPLMMVPTAKRHMTNHGRTAYQGHKWMDALGRIPQERRNVYVDVGAHCALWAWFLSQYFKNTVAFEPIPLHAALFRANFGLSEEEFPSIDTSNDDRMLANSVYEAQPVGHGRVSLIECALGNEHATISIECAADETGSAHVAQKGGGDLRQGHGELLTYANVQMLKLDDFMDFMPDGVVDFVKIDVEGFELPVVQGGEKFFKTFKPWVIVEQKSNDTIYGDMAHAASAQLGKWGWRDVKVISGDHCMEPPV